MIFLTYDFVWFALAFYLLYYFSPIPSFRIASILIGSILFQYYYGGWTSLLPVGVLTIVVYAAGRIGSRRVIVATIVLCVACLAIYKYTHFVAMQLVGSVAPDWGAVMGGAAQKLLPAAIPLGISFIVFEFAHYLIDLLHSNPPVRRFRDFLAFALFWPTMVAGPIKRYQQFIPALHEGLKRPTSTDAMIGITRVAIGFTKKWAADNLTGWIEYTEPQYVGLSREHRWLFVLALSTRILLDFSGYSDMAIGYARMMGVAVPENFNWPYLARSTVEFWQRWHISLSSWIRDYIYIPLGGNRLGVPRRILNALAAMAICGLWHGASWNFVVWGLYHGVGLSVGTLWERGRQRLFGSAARSVGALPAMDGRRGLFALDQYGVLSRSVDVMGWAVTMVFVCIGWLLFFYPVDKAWMMIILLFK